MPCGAAYNIVTRTEFRVLRSFGERQVPRFWKGSRQLAQEPILPFPTPFRPQAGASDDDSSQSHVLLGNDTYVNTKSGYPPKKLRELKYFALRMYIHAPAGDLHLCGFDLSHGYPRSRRKKHRFHCNAVGEATIRSLHGRQNISAKRSAAGFLFPTGRATWRERDPGVVPGTLASDVARWLSEHRRRSESLGSTSIGVRACRWQLQGPSSVVEGGSSVCSFFRQHNTASALGM